MQAALWTMAGMQAHLALWRVILLARKRESSHRRRRLQTRKFNP